MLNGKEITIDNGNRFNRSLTQLSIKIKPLIINIKQNCDKSLVNNEYLPININLLDKPDTNLKPMLNKIKTAFNKAIKFSK